MQAASKASWGEVLHDKNPDRFQGTEKDTEGATPQTAGQSWTLVPAFACNIPYIFMHIGASVPASKHKGALGCPVASKPSFLTVPA